MTFEEWLERVDSILEALCGMSSEDLPDIDYYTLFENRYHPQRAARKAIVEAGAY